MFKLDTSNSYKWPVEFQTILPDGSVIDNKFIAEFKRKPREEVTELSQQILESENPISTASDLADIRDLVADEDVSIDDVIKQIDSRIERINSKKTAKELIDRDVDRVMGIMTGWDGVDINGDTSFSRDNVRLLLNGVPNILLAIMQSFFRSSMGDLQQKNSKKPRATGR